MAGLRDGWWGCFEAWANLTPREIVKYWCYLVLERRPQRGRQAAAQGSSGVNLWARSSPWRASVLPGIGIPNFTPCMRRMERDEWGAEGTVGRGDVSSCCPSVGWWGSWVHEGWLERRDAVNGPVARLGDRKVLGGGFGWVRGAEVWRNWAEVSGVQ